MLRVCGLEEIAARGDRLDVRARVHHATSLAPERIPLPPLQAGAAFLEHSVIRELPGVPGWRASHYDTIAPAVFVLRDAVVHGAAGILRIGDDVVRESLAHTSPQRNRYRKLPDGIVLEGARFRRLAGTHVTTLAGGAENYFHGLIEGVMRLAMVPSALLEAADSVLYPADGLQLDRVVGLLGPPSGLAYQPVENGDTLLVERLIFPLSLHGLFHYHRSVVAAFDRISSNIDDRNRGFPRRIFLDRRGSGSRPLVNETELVEALRPLGFVTVAPETLDFADQARLFRGASAIVAPHGAGLTNLGFCRPGCAVLELHMDAYTNWCYRLLSALRGLTYDCFFGRAIGPWPEMSHMVNASSWIVSTQHVVSAVRWLIARSEQSAQDR